jgi:predicted DNA-binding protein
MAEMTPKRRVGRPPLPKASRRGKLIKMRVTSEEWRQIKRLAKERSKTVADLLREAFELRQ